jgi:hypothetical protein
MEFVPLQTTGSYTMQFPDSSNNEMANEAPCEGGGGWTLLSDGIETSVGVAVDPTMNLHELPYVLL